MSSYQGDWARNAHHRALRIAALTPSGLCRSNYDTDAGRRPEPGDRIVRCGLPTGHDGDHDEMIHDEPGNTWPRRADSPAYDLPISALATYGPHPTGMGEIQYVIPIPGDLTTEQAEAFRAGWATAYQAGWKAAQPGDTPPHGGSAGDGVTAVTPCVEGFHWIGQSFAHCDECGLPAWEHAGWAEPVSPLISPFDTITMLRLKPFVPGEADGIRAKWEAVRP